MSVPEKTKTKKEKGMVFGVFDGLHEGHRHFLSSARNMREDLVVVVATDAAARVLKASTPRFSLDERIAAISAAFPALAVVAGDEVPGSWKILDAYTPDIVILGYDQDAIAAELDQRSIPYIYAGSHEPARFKSSILNAPKPKDGETG